MCARKAAATRLPAYATSIGRVLLAHQEPAWRDAYLASVKPGPLTPSTVTDPERLRAILVRLEVQDEEGWALARFRLEP